MIKRDGVTYPDCIAELLATGRWQPHPIESFAAAGWVLCVEDGKGYRGDDAVAKERDRALVAALAEARAEVERLRAAVPPRERVIEALARSHWRNYHEAGNAERVAWAIRTMQRAIDGELTELDLILYNLASPLLTARLLGIDVREPSDQGSICPGEHCKMCNGEACNLCGAGCWSPPGSVHCEHDVDERHRDPEAETPASDGTGTP
jgi:hypothetical protein